MARTDDALVALCDALASWDGLIAEHVLELAGDPANAGKKRRVRARIDRLLPIREHLCAQITALAPKTARGAQAKDAALRSSIAKCASNLMAQRAVEG